MSAKLKNVLKNIGVTIAILGASSVFCLLLQPFSETDNHVPLLFVLAVFCVSRFTDGYVYGILASVVAVICVNGVFTYPYFEINFTITGYPLTFAVMFAVAFSVSAMTTQIKNQEQIRLEAEKEKVRGNLLRAISHDIRTPLTAIAGSASGLIENFRDLPDERALELLEGIREEAQWLIRIVENLLSITRIGDGKARIDKQEELVEEIVGEAIEKFQKRFPQIQVDAVLPDEVLLVPMDGILIEQVLVNLLENSVIHGNKTTRIVIRAEDEGEQVKFSVEDNGDGIPKSVLPEMFEGKMESRNRGEPDAKRNVGIGLSVCRTIVRAHKGNMEAENREEGGARVMFWLPKGMEIENGD